MENTRLIANHESARLVAKFQIDGNGQELIRPLGDSTAPNNRVAIREWVLRQLRAGVEEPTSSDLERLLGRILMEEFPTGGTVPF